MTSPVQETSLHLIFQVGGETLALDVSEVRAILALSAMTATRDARPGLRGSLFISGTVVPVIDIHEKLGLPADDDSHDACILVIERESGRTEDLFGVIVDRVKEVTAQNIESHPGKPRLVSLLAIGAAFHASARHTNSDDLHFSKIENAPARS